MHIHSSQWKGVISQEVKIRVSGFGLPSAVAALLLQKQFDTKVRRSLTCIFLLLKISFSCALYSFI